MFSTLFSTHRLNAQVIGHTNFFLKVLKDKTSPFIKATQKSEISLFHINISTFDTL